MPDCNKKFGHVVVLHGGSSSEREVSLATGKQVYNGLKAAGINCTLIDVKNDLIDQLQALKPDIAFIALHGTQGEDGTIQGLLEIMRIPYTGSDVKSSALSLDKYRSKLVWKSLGIDTPDFCIVKNSTPPKKHPFPCFVKATIQGSTIGVYAVKDKEKLTTKIKNAKKHSPEVILEQWITGDEFTVSILNDKTLPTIRIKPNSVLYDYKAKYISDETGFFCPSGLSDDDEKKIQSLALQAFQSLGCSGWGRVDLMRDEHNKFWVIEVNTVPGMTSHSLVPLSAKAAGIEFSDLLINILNTAK